MTTASLGPEPILPDHESGHHLPDLHLADLGSALVDAAAAIEAVALHVAATALSKTASLADRERLRSRWAATLKVAEMCRHPHWHVVYLPGMTFNDGETWAVHRRSGRVVGDCPETRQGCRESTDDWLNRLP